MHQAYCSSYFPFANELFPHKRPSLPFSILFYTQGCQELSLIWPYCWMASSWVQSMRGTSRRPKVGKERDRSISLHRLPPLMLHFCSISILSNSSRQPYPITSAAKRPRNTFPCSFNHRHIKAS